MNKIEYPADTKTLHNEYYKVFNAKKVKSIDAHLSKIKFEGANLNFKTLCVLSIEKLIDLKNEIEKFSEGEKEDTGKKHKGNIVYKNKFNELFNYKGLQPKLANFFMNKGKIRLNICNYCGIDFINAFVDFPDYKKGIDFINQSDIYELMMIKKMDIATANDIIKKRPHADYSKIVVKNKTLNEIKSIPFNNSHNHFTLDHLIPQGKHPYFSLCLYNLVPSCYSCNSKFKNDVEFDIDKDLLKISPTSGSYNLNQQFNFWIFYSKRFEDLKSEQDFELKRKVDKPIAHIQNYLKMFKIMGRYAAHKPQILDLIKIKQKYPDSKIKELSDLTGLSRAAIMRMVFGEDLYDPKPTDKPFTKFRKDIAKNIKIPGVI